MGKKINNNYRKVLLCILIMLSFFGLNIINSNGWKYIFTPLLLYFACKNYKQTPMYKLILLYVFLVICSCVYSYLYNHQNLFKVIINSYDYLGLLFIFIISKFKLTANQTIKLIRNLSVIFCVSYIIQWFIYPIPIFSGALDETNIRDTFFRMRMPGSICAYCMYFYGVNRYILTKRILFLCYILLGFIPIIIMGFRSLTAITFACTIIMIYFVTRKVHKFILYLILSLILALPLSQLSIVQTKIEEMKDRQESNQTFENDDYIRFVEYAYFSEIQFIKPGERFWGGGEPVMDNSTAYAKEMKNNADEYKYYWVDLGLVGLSFIIGIPSVVLLIFIIMRCIKQCKEPELQFIRFTLLTTILGSLFTSMEIYRTGNLLIISLYLYVINIYHENRIINFSSCT